ncbi:MAG: helix-turn-helix domain-containing protein [Anaerolineae bacterium]
MDDIKISLNSDDQPRRADFVKNRDLLLQTARRLFNQQGVEQVSMYDIAKAAGVGQGTLYRHFENKMELAMALLDADHRDWQDRTLSVMRQPADALTKLDWFITEALQFVDRNSQLLCVSTDIIGSMQHTAHWWWRQTIRGLLDEVHSPTNRDFLADTIYMMLDVHNVYFMRQMRNVSLADLTANFLQFVHHLIS